GDAVGGLGRAVAVGVGGVGDGADDGADGVTVGLAREAVAGVVGELDVAAVFAVDAGGLARGRAGVRARGEDGGARGVGVGDAQHAVPRVVGPRAGDAVREGAVRETADRVVGEGGDARLGVGEL